MGLPSSPLIDQGRLRRLPAGLRPAAVPGVRPGGRSGRGGEPCPVGRCWSGPDVPARRELPTRRSTLRPPGHRLKQHLPFGSRKVLRTCDPRRDLSGCLMRCPSGRWAPLWVAGGGVVRDRSGMRVRPHFGRTTVDSTAPTDTDGPEFPRLTRLLDVPITPSRLS